MKPAVKARLQIIAAMAIWGTIAVFTRQIAVSSSELALYRALLATAIIGLYLLVTGQKLHLRSLGRELPLLFLSGAAMGFNWILLFEAYKYTTVSIATLSYYFAPVLVMALSPLLFREKLTRKQIFCFVMSTVGLILIIGVGEGSGSMTGILFGLGAAVLYAFVVLLNKHIRSVSGLHRTILQFMAAIAVLTPYVLATDGIHLGGLDGTGIFCLLVLGFVHTGLAYCMYFSSLKDIPGQEAAILSYVDPLVAILASVLFLQESMTPLQLLGGAMILGFTLWNEIE